MSRKLLAILLSELNTVRIKCPKCAAVAEMTVELMAFRLDGLQCPVCKCDWHGLAVGNNDNRFRRLAKAIREYQDSHEAPEIEFVLPDTGKP